MIGIFILIVIFISWLVFHWLISDDHILKDLQDNWQHLSDDERHEITEILRMKL